MKKILILLISLLVLPITANALEVSTGLLTGEKVQIMVDGTNRFSFYVIEDSNPGNPYVWALLVGTTDPIGKHDYDLHNPSAGIYATGVLEKAHISRDVLEVGTATWTKAVEAPRLLKLEDLTNMGVTKGEVSGKYEIKSKQAFILDVYAPVARDTFWTQSCVDGCNEAGTNTPVSMYVVTYKADTSDGVYATLEPALISVISNGPQHLVRPVAKFNKADIYCKLDENDQPITTAVVPPKTNPPTSAETFPVQLLSVAAFAGIIYVIVRKKEIFAKL